MNCSHHAHALLLPFCLLFHSFHHHNNSTQRGESEVEALAKSIEARRDARIEITFDVKVALLRACRQVAIEKGYPVTRIDLADLKNIRDNTILIRERAQKGLMFKLKKLLRFRSQSEQMVRVLDEAVLTVEEEQEDADKWFYYMDCKLVLLLFSLFCNICWYCHITHHSFTPLLSRPLLHPTGKQVALDAFRCRHCPNVVVGVLH